MSLIDTVISLLAPHYCVGCDTEGSLLCSGCAVKFKPVSLLCLNKDFAIKSVAAYEGVAKDLVWKLKAGGAQAAAPIMARHMARLVEPIRPDRELIVVPVTTATARVRQRGYDQAKLLAHALSRQAGLTYMDCLARHGQSHQVGAGREQRLHQLSGAFRVTKPSDIAGAYILLVDDVVTTGATLETAAKTLKKAGAAHIEAVTFAQAMLTGQAKQ